jgi:putative ABC transport system substrate-binding protein
MALSSVLPVGAQSPSYQVAAIIPGLSYHPVLRGVQEGLGRSGFHTGKNLAFIVYNFDGDLSNLAEQTAKIVAAKPDLILTLGTAITSAVQRATATIPIVFTYVAEPQKFGLTANFTSSENNLTGVSHYAARVSGKRLEILKEIAPHITNILTIVAPNERVAEESFRFLEQAAEKLAIHIIRRDVAEKEDIEPVLRALPRGAADAIYHIPSSLVSANIDLLIAKAREDKLPMVLHESAMVERGALVSYGSDARLTGIQAAELMAMILQGAKPSDLAIQMPEQLHLAVNLTTARAIGLKIPRNLLERVDQLVE